jgi:hypothetical protein
VLKYVDIPNMHEFNETSIAFFDALAETENTKFFE